jgi:hypothetical protein
MVRAIFGLGGLLVTIGVIVYIMGGNGGELDQTKQMLDTQGQLQSGLNQIAGHNTDGTGSANQSVTLDVQTANGNINGAQVTDIQPGGAYAKYYGLQKDDFITKIGDDALKDGQLTSQKDVEDALLDAYQHGRPIVVMRDGQPLTLPIAPPPGQPARPAQQGGSRPIAQGAVQMLNNALNGSGAQIPSH